MYFYNNLKSQTPESNRYFCKTSISRSDERHYSGKDGEQEKEENNKNNIRGQHHEMDRSKQLRDLCHNRKQRRTESSSSEGSAGIKRFNKRRYIL